MSAIVAVTSVWRKEKADVLALLSIPVLLFLINPVWLSNRFSDIDTWFYYGNFLHLFDYRFDTGDIGNDYYRTRLPYILPGAVIYRFFSDSVARFIFMELVYSAIILSFWYVIRTHTSRPIAFASASLLALDLYFLRSVGWQYVDNGVLAYQALTLAFITAAAKGNTPWRYYALAGFTAASMIFTHLGSGAVVFTFALYVYILTSRASPNLPLVKRIREPVLFALLGVGICQIFYGILNLWFYHDRFFFLSRQLKEGASEANSLLMAMPLSYLVQSAAWLTVPGAALIGSIIGLAVSVQRRKSMLDFDVFCLFNAAFLLSIVTLLEVLHRAFFLSRDGEYISFFLIPAYLAIAALLFQPGITGWRIAALVVATFTASAWYRLAYDGHPAAIADHMKFASKSDQPGFTLEMHIQLPVAWLAIIAGAALPLPLIFRRAGLTVVSLLIFCAVTIMTPWTFHRDDSINATASLIRTVAGDRLPRIFFSASDPERPLFWSIVATFTERGWFRHGEGYPDFSKNLWETNFSSDWWPPGAGFHSGDLVVVLSSTVKDLEAAQTALSRYVQNARLVASFQIPRPDATLWAHCFEIQMPAFSSPNTNSRIP